MVNNMFTVEKKQSNLPRILYSVFPSWILCIKTDSEPPSMRFSQMEWPLILRIRVVYVVMGESGTSRPMKTSSTQKRNVLENKLNLFHQEGWWWWWIFMVKPCSTCLTFNHHIGDVEKTLAL